MESNTSLWDGLFKTEPTATKKFTRAGGFSGTAIKPFWVVKRLTETFGPMGIGWGWDVIEEKTFDSQQTGETLWLSQISLWYVIENRRFSTSPQWGQTTMVAKRANGSFFLDEEAPKKSITDAFTKCASYLGLGGDVHMGLFDDSKYVAEQAEEKPKVIVTVDDAKKAIADKAQKPVYSLMDDIGEITTHGTPAACLTALGRLLKDSDDPAFTWGRNYDTFQGIQEVAKAKHDDSIIDRCNKAQAYANERAEALNKDLKGAGMP